MYPLLHTRFRSRYRPQDILAALAGDTIKVPTNMVVWCKNWEKEA